MRKCEFKSRYSCMILKDDLTNKVIECCYIAPNDDPKEGCKQSAVAMIGDGPYEVTYSCGDHVEDMREPGRDWMQLGDGRYFAPGVRP